MNKTYSDPIAWSFWSSDLSLPDFFTSGVAEDAIVSKIPTLVDQLQNEIDPVFQ